MAEQVVTTTRVAFAEPPRISGVAQVDFSNMVEWLWEFYNSAILSRGLVQQGDLDESLTPILANLGEIVGAADKLPYLTGADTWAITDFTAFGRALVGAIDADAAAIVFDIPERAQDAIGSALLNTETIVWTYTDSTPSIEADVVTQLSITADSGGVKLVNDVLAPGNDYQYGTDTVGAKGWQDRQGVRYWFNMVNGDPVNPQFIMGFGKPITFWKTLTEAYP